MRAGFAIRVIDIAKRDSFTVRSRTQQMVQNAGYRTGTRPNTENRFGPLGVIGVPVSVGC